MGSWEQTVTLRSVDDLFYLLPSLVAWSWTIGPLYKCNTLPSFLVSLLSHTQSVSLSSSYLDIPLNISLQQTSEMDDRVYLQHHQYLGIVRQIWILFLILSQWKICLHLYNLQQYIDHHLDLNPHSNYDVVHLPSWCQTGNRPWPGEPKFQKAGAWPLQAALRQNMVWSRPMEVHC